MPLWLKSGVLLTLVDILFWLIFIIWAFQGESDLSGLAITGGIYYGLISIIPSFLVGSFIGGVINYIIASKENNSAKGMKIGFSISVILILVYFSLYEIYQIFFIRGFYVDFAPALIILPISIVLIGTLIGWFIGKFVK